LQLIRFVNATVFKLKVTQIKILQNTKRQKRLLEWYHSGGGNL